MFLARRKALAHVVDEADEGGFAGGGDLDVHAIDVEHAQRLSHVHHMVAQHAGRGADPGHVGLALGLHHRQRFELRGDLLQTGDGDARDAFVERAGHSLDRGDDAVDRVDRGGKRGAGADETCVHARRHQRQRAFQIGCVDRLTL